MKKLFQLSYLTLAFISINALGHEEDPITYVNPFIGTGGHGHTYPGASKPFGMIQLSPDTRIDGWDGCGGYHYSDNVVHGFSHTHLSGTGVSDYGDLLIMPFTGDDKWENATKTSLDKAYSSRFSHESENAHPGYYSVQLLDYNINASLTASNRCGFHRYIFPQGKNRKIIIDLEHRDELIDSDLIFLNDSTIVGKRVSKAWAQEQHFYFCIRVSEKPISHRFQKNEKGKSTKLIVEFDSSSPILSVKVGISSVDLYGAKNNLNTEMPHWSDFQYRLAAEKEWRSELGKIKVETPVEDDKHIFYTALYHSYLCPNLFTDVDGRYRGMDMQIHQAGKFKQYTIFSLWDTFRAAHPLYTITQPERSVEFLHTFLRQYKEGGILPIWELNANYTGCMIGYHSIPVFTDALVKGLKDFDTDLALEAMIYSAERNHLGLEAYKKNGFISSEDESESVSKTLEYAYDDWCIAVFAEMLNKDSIAAHYYKRAQSYKHIYNPNSTFMQPRYNGGWKNNFSPYEVTFDYTEANSWQYSLFAPHDMEGLIELLGGKDKLELWLDDLFTAEPQTTGRDQVDITGLIGQYAHGNEPSHHMAYLYNYTNAPYKTQKYVRQILKTLYFNAPDGLSGNEDCGQMSSWYVFSSLGFYPVTPGSPYYMIGAPVFKSASIEVEKDVFFTIKTLNFSVENKYVEEVKLNGKVINRNYLLHSEIMNGGVIEYKMSAEPKDFSVNHPPFEGISPKILPAPTVSNSDAIFSKKKKVEINASKETEIFYSLNDVENESTPQYQLYKKPIKLKKSARLTYYSKSASSQSPTVESTFYKQNDDWKIEIINKYHHSYSGGGDNALIDHLYGGTDFRTGAWQGYYGVDMDVRINFKKKLTINNINVRFLQDARSWIWFPSEVQFLISNNGKDWHTFEVVKNKTSPKEYGVIIEEFGFNKTFKTKHLRIVAKYMGPCPKWHPGAGNASFIFADEITVN